MDACQFNSIVGLRRLVLYENKNIVFRRPDITKVDEINMISYSGGVLVADFPDMPTWRRTTETGENYGQLFTDELSFNFHSYSEDVQATLKYLRESRYGWIAEIQTNNGEVYLTKDPVFLQMADVKEPDAGAIPVRFMYRVRSNKNFYFKLNSLIFDRNFIYGDVDAFIGEKSLTAAIYK